MLCFLLISNLVATDCTHVFDLMILHRAKIHLFNYNGRKKKKSRSNRAANLSQELN